MKDNKESNKKNIKLTDKKEIETKEVKKSSYTKKKEFLEGIYLQVLPMLNPHLIIPLFQLRIFMEM